MKEGLFVLGVVLFAGGLAVFQFTTLRRLQRLEDIVRDLLRILAQVSKPKEEV